MHEDSASGDSSASLNHWLWFFGLPKAGPRAQRSARVTNKRFGLLLETVLAVHSIDEWILPAHTVTDRLRMLHSRGPRHDPQSADLAPTHQDPNTTQSTSTWRS